MSVTIPIAAMVMVLGVYLYKTWTSAGAPKRYVVILSERCGHCRDLQGFLDGTGPEHFELVSLGETPHAGCSRTATSNERAIAQGGVPATIVSATGRVIYGNWSTDLL